MAWAEFIDKTKDINDPANYIQGSLQCSIPDPNQIGEYWKKNHPNWLEIADTWKPPIIVLPPTNEQIILQITELESKQARSVREFILGDVTAKERVKTIDEQIIVLRGSLK